MKAIKALFISTALLGAAGMAFAEPSCSVPKDKWMPEAQFKKMVEDHGYTIKNFKVNKGQCYEVYGMKEGKKVEHWFNPETGERVTK